MAFAPPPCTHFCFTPPVEVLFIVMPSLVLLHTLTLFPVRLIFFPVAEFQCSSACLVTENLNYSK